MSDHARICLGIAKGNLSLHSGFYLSNNGPMEEEVNMENCLDVLDSITDSNNK
jgi:hypothetical protein